MANNADTIRRWAPLIGGGALVACTAVFLFRKLKGRRMTEGGEGGSGEEGEKTFRGKWRLPEGARLVQPGDRDRVEEASYESFPASDPPAYTPTRVG